MNRLHIICFDQPYPPTYGGVVDVFYKILELHKAGVRLVLHIFLYGDSVAQPELEQYAEEVHYYPLIKGKKLFCSMLPYFIGCRKNKKLIEDLATDDDPVLFEGIHTCGWINDPRLRNRYKIVRAHNVELAYYWHLFLDTKWCKQKLIFLNEVIKLFFTENYLLSRADRILTLSEADCRHFKKSLTNKDVRLTNCFFRVPTLPMTPSKPVISDKYVLYHGNLAISDNEYTAKYIIEKILPLLKKDVKFVLAGKNPSARLAHILEHNGNVILIPNPSMVDMENILYYSHVNLMLTFQSTGSKLKILNSLASSEGFCIANDKMLVGNHLSELCVVASSDEEIAEAIEKCLNSPITEGILTQRHKSLLALGYNDVSNITN